MRLSATERVHAAYALIDEVDRPEVWILLRPRADAMADAARVDQLTSAGVDLPLAGLLVAVKDNVDVAGLATTAACPGFSYVPAVSATAVARLTDAGAIVLGKTNMDQFATGLVGTRSPYGAVRSARDPELVSGGSSSGSAVAVALGIADIGIGTDTAGSGRVPAGLNQIVGLKPTRGLVPLTGVVPAARPYDTVTVFARTIESAVVAIKHMSGPDPQDPQTRAWPRDTMLAAPACARIAVPDRTAMAACAPSAVKALDAACARLSAAGHVVTAVDMACFLEAGRMLYASALVAERYSAVGEFVSTHADEVDPVVGQIVRDAAALPAAALADAQHRIRELRHEVEPTLAAYDALLVPTTTEHPRIADVVRDPVAINARMGTFTNFVNLFDLSAIAVPVEGESAGVTFIGDRFADQVLIDLASDLVGETAVGTYPPVPNRLVVFGAHRRGQPLEHQLVTRGARFLDMIRTAPAYRMVALPGDPPKPGILPDASGASLVGELWGLSDAALGSFLAELPQPMSLGRILLADGSSAIGFQCSTEGARDSAVISDVDDWLDYLEKIGVGSALSTAKPAVK